MAARPRVNTMPPMNESPLQTEHFWGAGVGAAVVDGTGVVGASVVVGFVEGVVVL